MRELYTFNLIARLSFYSGIESTAFLFYFDRYYNITYYCHFVFGRCLLPKKFRDCPKKMTLPDSGGCSPVARTPVNNGAGVTPLIH